MALAPHGPWVVTTAEHARAVFTDPDRFDFPADVSRRGAPRRDEVPSSTRSPHSITPPLTPAAVERGVATFATELERSTDVLSRVDTDAMMLLRDPVALSTVHAVLPELLPEQRAGIAARTLEWIDALGPIIASTRPRTRWSRARRLEDRTRLALEGELARAGVADPAGVATVLAAGVQVPVAAGAWLLVKLAENPSVADSLRDRPDLARGAAWETVRLSPPTWITARITREPVTLGDARIPEGAVVFLSPLLLGRLGSLVPHGEAGDDLESFDPERWDQEQIRPGAWLPFGAGPHACPGRNLGLAQLVHLAIWATDWKLSLVVPARVDQSRGIFPNPARLRFHQT